MSYELPSSLVGSWVRNLLQILDGTSVKQTKTQEKIFKNNNLSFNFQIRVLVAGGCNGWCKENPAIASAEMFDPETNLWTKVADLPVPINRLESGIMVISMGSIKT